MKNEWAITTKTKYLALQAAEIMTTTTTNSSSSSRKKKCDVNSNDNKERETFVTNQMMMMIMIEGLGPIKHRMKIIWNPVYFVAKQNEKK